MQYSIVRTLGKNKGYGGRYTEIDLTGLTFRDLYQNYLDVHFEVSHPTYTQPKYVKLEDFQTRISNADITPNDWLASIDNESLPTVEGELKIVTDFVGHRDAFMAGYDVERTVMGYHPETEFPMKERKDLLMKKDGVDYSKLQDNCIVTVNGFVQQTSASEHGLYIVDGAYGQDNANETTIGITSFETLGGIEIINVDENNIYQPNEDNKLYQYTYVNLGVPTENRAVLMVMGGYLHVLDNSYKSIGDGLVRIDFNNYPLIQRYYESMGYIDLSSLEYTPFDNNESQRSVKELLESNSFIKQMLNLKQTFFIVVNNPNVFVERYQLEKSGLVGTFYSEERPMLPLVTQRGKLKEYWSYEDDGKWVVNCNSNLVPNYIFEQTQYRKLDNVTNQLTPYTPYTHDRGFLLGIGSDSIKEK
tara:strand:- start:20748 stop:21998 length:1251 start_codon:yes stop_codon:yes gene_type:complete